MRGDSVTRMLDEFNLLDPLFTGPFTAAGARESYEIYDNLKTMVDSWKEVELSM